ncbi:MAG: RDD family protein [Actinomycetota bacterium]|nr:RDD family protein [Actinomycetota bacterium]
MSYQSDPNQPWGTPPAGGQPPAYPPPGGQASDGPPPSYPPAGGQPGGQPYGNQPYGGQPPGYQPYPNQPYANQPGQPVLAGWWYRAGASIIDGLIIGVVSGVISAASGSRAVSYIVSALIGLAYATLLIGSGGRTVGNMALGTKTVDAAGGTTIGYGRAFVRWLISALLEITVIGGILDILWPLWDDKNQTIHDKAAKSVVVITR